MHATSKSRWHYRKRKETVATIPTCFESYTCFFEGFK